MIKIFDVAERKGTTAKRRKKERVRIQSPTASSEAVLLKFDIQQRVPLLVLVVDSSPEISFLAIPDLLINTPCTVLFDPCITTCSWGWGVEDSLYFMLSAFSAAHVAIVNQSCPFNHTRPLLRL